MKWQDKLFAGSLVLVLVLASVACAFFFARAIF